MKAIISEIVQKICQLVDVELIILFGSMARHQSTAKSDIDLGVLLSDLHQKEKLYQELSHVYFEKPVDLIILNRADPLLRFEVVREGKVLYEKDSGIYANFAVKAIKEYYDTSKLRKVEEIYLQNYLKGDVSNDSRCHPPQVD